MSTIEYKTTIPGLKLTLECDCDATGEGMEDGTEGSGQVSIPREQIREAGVDWVTLTQYNMSGEPRTSALCCVDCGEELAECECEYFICEGADEAIALLWRLSQGEGAREVTVRFVSEGSAFWMFHDLGHVAQDAAEAADGGCEISSIEADREDAAHLYGARLALRAGMELSEVLTETVRIRDAHRERFGVPSEAVENLLRMVSAALPRELSDILAENL